MALDDKHLKLSLEQLAIFDGEPKFIEPFAVMNLLNHHSMGGTLDDLRTIRDDPEAFGIQHGAKRYRVTVLVYAEPLNGPT